MDTHGGAGDGFTGSRKPERAPMCGCRPIMTGRGVQGEQFAHIAARLAVCAMQLLTYSWGGSLASKGGIQGAVSLEFCFSGSVGVAEGRVGAGLERAYNGSMGLTYIRKRPPGQLTMP